MAILPVNAILWSIESYNLLAMRVLKVKLHVVSIYEFLVVFSKPLPRPRAESNYWVYHVLSQCEGEKKRKAINLPKTALLYPFRAPISLKNFSKVFDAEKLQYLPGVFLYCFFFFFLFFFFAVSFVFQFKDTQFTNIVTYNLSTPTVATKF